MQKDENTRDRILEAARKIFHEKGLNGARMQEIANEAEINKAMLHYYFRTKRDLFEQVFQETFQDFVPKILSVLKGKSSLEEKVSNVVNAYSDLLSSNPALPLFIFNELQQNPDLFFQQTLKTDPAKPISGIMAMMMQIQEAIQQGEIKAIDPRQFFINVVSLTVFPFLMRPVLIKLLNMSDQDFHAFVDFRRTFIPEFIMQGLQPESNP